MLRPLHLCLGILPVLCACATTPRVSTLHYAEEPPTWFEDGYSWLDVSPDGERALYRGRRRVVLVDLVKGQPVEPSPWEQFAIIRDAVFLPDGTLACSGELAGTDGWFVQKGSSFVVTELPADARPRWSPDRQSIAFIRGRSDTQVHILRDDEELVHGFVAPIVAIAWSQDSRTLYLLQEHESGAATLLKVDPSSGVAEPVIEDLDAPPSFGNSLALDPNGTRIYLALASSGPPDLEARHRPNADRDLDIYSVDLETGRLRVEVADPGDDFALVISGNRLFWTHNEVHESIVTLPMTGGPSRELLGQGQMPSWHPNGRLLAFTYGGWRVADWGLNMDAATIALDADGQAIGELEPIVSGYHEDFTPAWSPDGRWLAYHSHRSLVPVAGYGSEGSTDDLYLKRAGDPTAEEIRLTDFGWEVGPADWSPDGEKLVFDSWQRGGTPGIGQVWIVKIDASNGMPLYSERLTVPEGLTKPLWQAWSPLSDEIAIEADMGNGMHAIWLVQADGSGGKKIHEYPASTYGGLDWTVDGRSLVYSGLEDGRMQVFRLPREGGMPQRLSQDQVSLLHPQVSPDGNSIACTRLHWRKEIRSVELR